MTDNTYISSNDFIWYFVTILQLNFLDAKKDLWCFNVEDLKKFISLSKKDYKYYNLLRDFNFEYFNAELFSINYTTAINNAKDKHVITVIVADVAYLSHININTSILYYYSEFEGIMRNFVEDFKFYLLNPKGYEELIATNSDVGEQARASYDYMVYNLKREITGREF